MKSPHGDAIRLPFALVDIVCDPGEGETAMWPALGAILFCASAAQLWFFRPKQGLEHGLLAMPVLQTVIPVGIVAGLALGFTLILAGILR